MALSAKLRLDTKVANLPRGTHYAWVIVAILTLVQVIASSIGMAAGVMVVPLQDPEGGFGWSIGAIAAAITVYYLIGAIFAPISGWLGDRYGPRRMLLLGSILYIVSMLLLGIINAPWHFFITFGVLLSLTQSISMVPLMAAVNRWFRRRLGVGVGILWAAGGVGTAILAPSISYLIENVGWRDTFWSVAFLGGGTMLLLTLVFRNVPADLGLKPYGAKDDDPPELVMSKENERLRVRVFNQAIRRTGAFWNLPAIHGLGCAGHGIILIYSIVIAYDRGVSPTAAAVILSLISIFSVGSRFITPVLAERFGGKPVMVSALFVQGITVVVLFWAQDVWMFYLFALLFGMGFGGEMSAYLVVNRQYFGSGPIAITYGFQVMGALTGHAIATGLAGLVLYVTGSYTAILAMSIAFSLTGVAVIMNLEPTSRVLIPDWQDKLPPEARVAEPALAAVVPHWDD